MKNNLTHVMWMPIEIRMCCQDALSEQRLNNGVTEMLLPFGEGKQIQFKDV